jgi:predicted transposase/invertase (TIGR01784 family)
MFAKIAAAWRDHDYRKFARRMALTKSRMDYAEDMYNSKQEGLQQGLQQGLQEGLQQGLQEKAFEIARKMKNTGRPLIEIQEFTGLPIETIEQL